MVAAFLSTQETARPGGLGPRLKAHWRFKLMAGAIISIVFFIGYFLLLDFHVFPVRVMPVTALDRLIAFRLALCCCTSRSTSIFSLRPGCWTPSGTCTPAAWPWADLALWDSSSFSFGQQPFPDRTAPPTGPSSRSTSRETPAPPSMRRLPSSRPFASIAWPGSSAIAVWLAA